MVAAFFAAVLLLPARGNAAVSSAPSVKNSQTLEVQIIVPPNWQPLLESRVTDVLLNEVDKVFHGEGFTGVINEVDALDEPVAGRPRLTITLIDWRMRYSGSIDCTFTATLQTDRTVRQLGAFSGIAFRWLSGPARFGLVDVFAEAADDAIRQLYSAIVRTKLLSNMAER